MSVTPLELRSMLTADRLLVIVRGDDPGRALECMRVLADGGIRLVEVSLTGVGSLDVLSRAATELSDRLVLGAGTVLTADDVSRAVSAGAGYVVTPASGAGEQEAHGQHLPVIAGALTPSEIWAAHQAGAAAVKLFPASLGGPGFVGALRAPFPDVALLPVGGVDEESVAAYLAAGAVAVGVGSPLLGDAPAGGDLSDLAQRVVRFRRAVA